ncbi:hypothetical protein PAXRUDRAFT_151271 [Paxillus rubicundulus Ve08.2h10]|uniref:Uncharacterized protein n=1 Tax=Paxillus rubicundulus Ve08.2h10 TaxID=930991 RepID=A0A0D0DIC6_9AGAM|nr:hypothetical protein PAXRUDRAFT_151271 [Paxillus rubicundulus Ve08.2h10]
MFCCCNGLIGCSPISPMMAISIWCLEFYHQLCCCQSSFGIQEFAKCMYSLPLIFVSFI